MTQEALKLALEALEESKDHIAKHRRLEAITAIKEALAQTEQEPVGQLLEDAFGFGRGQIMWFNKPKDKSMLYTTPPQRTWVGLTDKDWNRSKHNYDFQKGADWAESILKRKNGFAEEKNT